MRISITPYVSSDIKNLTSLLLELSTKMSFCFESMQYGDSINVFLIGCICVHPSLDAFFKPRRSRYTDYQETVFDCRLCKFERTFECELKLDYSIMSKATEEEAKKIVAQSIIEFLHVLKMPKKVTDFDKDRFVADMEAFFREEQLID